jgi:tripartite-type tricarboxylate transporter receptor subunit TctC
MDWRAKQRDTVLTAVLVIALCTILIISIGFMVARAHAQADVRNWPVKPIHAIVPFTAGSTTDIGRMHSAD